MKFGPFMLWQVPKGRRAEEVILRETELMIKAEDWGYDTVYIAEHHFCHYSPAGVPEVALGHVAARTKRIRLGTAVSVLPLHHPLSLAEAWATVDVYSGGRLELGVGRGYNWFEFDSMGIDLAENTARFVECLEILQRAWTEERVDYQGKFYQVRDTEVIPKPVQKPHPPLWYASIRKQSAKMVGNLGLGLCPVFDAGPQELRERRDLWAHAARESGYTDAWIEATVENTPLQRIVWVAESDTQAEEELQAMLSSFAGLAQLCAWPGTGYPGRTLPPDRVQYPERYKQGWLETRFDFDELKRNYSVLVGLPATVRRQIEELIDQVPVPYIMMWTSIGGPQWEDQERCLRLFADQVMPHFK